MRHVPRKSGCVARTIVNVALRHWVRVWETSFCRYEIPLPANSLVERIALGIGDAGLLAFAYFSE